MKNKSDKVDTLQEYIDEQAEAISQRERDMKKKSIKLSRSANRAAKQERLYQ